MKNLFTALFDYRVKRVSLILAVLVFITDIIIRQTGDIHVNSYEHHVLFQYLVLISLWTAVSSKDKVDDELSMRVRYGILKNTYGLVVLVFGALAIFLSHNSINSLTTLTIMYCLECILVIHLVLYYFGIRYSPKWLLSEETAPKEINLLIIGFMIVFFVMVLVLIFLGILTDLKS